MKRFLYISLVVLIALSFATGCATISPGKTSKKKTSDRTLYSQVPASMRADVKEADFDLKEAKRLVKLAKDKVEIGKMKKELGDKQKKLSGYELKAAEKTLEEKEINVEVKKWEAIDNANLGDKIDNIKKVAKLRSKRLSAEADAVEAKADITTTRIEIKKLQRKISKMEAKTKE